MIKRQDYRLCVYKIVTQIPLGRVSTYGLIASRAGISPRLVGRALHQNTDPDSVPCHRVVRSDGTLADGYVFGGQQAQLASLQREGIAFCGKKIKNFASVRYGG